MSGCKSQPQWILGTHAVAEIVKARPASVRELWIEEGRRGQDVDSASSQAARAGAKVRRVGRREMDRLARGKPHQGFAARVDLDLESSLDDFLERRPDGAREVLVALDEIQDPHNLGAIGRSALNLGAVGIILPERRSSPVSPAAVRSSAGALGKISVFPAVNLGRALESCRERGFWIYGLDMGGTPLWRSALNLPMVLVVGSEGGGLRPSIRGLCDEIVAIPQAAGGVQSLNASCAAAVVLYESRRRENAAGNADSGRAI
ncbi:MAG: 23S rRNA (guanosine(2251)-2'-O)-methyltransferase RlmB [Elusimicrobiota bacterium]